MVRSPADIGYRTAIWYIPNLHHLSSIISVCLSFFIWIWHKVYCVGFSHLFSLHMPIKLLSVYHKCWQTTASTLLQFIKVNGKDANLLHYHRKQKNYWSFGRALMLIYCAWSRERRKLDANKQEEAARVGPVNVSATRSIHQTHLHWSCPMRGSLSHRR